MIKKYILPAAAILVAVSIFFVFNGSKDKGLEVEAAKAGKGDVVKIIRASGVLEAGDFEEINVPAGQKVLKVYAEENQQVTKGQLLAELDAGDLNNQLEKARLNGKQLASELAELKRPSTVSDREAVKNSMILAENQYKDLERQLKDAEDKLEQDRQLYESGALAEGDYKASLSSRDGLANRLAQAAITLENARNAYKDYDRSKALKIDAKDRQIAANNVDIASLTQKIEDSRIKASMDGTLAEFNLKEGRLPQAGTIIRIYDLSRFSFRADVPQEDAVQISEGQSAYVKLKGLQKEYKAKVTEVKRYAAIDNNSGSRTPKVKIKLALTEPDSSLAAGYDAEGYIEVGRVTGVVVVKREALRAEANGQEYLFLIVDGKVKKTPVVTGLQDDFIVEIKSGVTEGAMVVTNPPEGLKDADKVKAVMK